MTQSQTHILKPRKRRVRSRVGVAFVHAAGSAGGVASDDFPMTFHIPDSGKSTLATGTLSAAIHVGIVALLLIIAALKPEVVEEIIPVQLMKERPKPPARKALAERRKLDFAPALQAAQPQIVNPRVIAEAAPAIDAQALQMDAVSAAQAPTQIARSSVSVDRVSAVGSVAGFRPTSVDVSGSAGPVVRGPVRAVGPVGPSVGPRKVVGRTGTTVGTGSLEIGGGSSVREGVISSRDVVGSPNAGELASVNIAVGEGNFSGGGGTGLVGNGAAADCLTRSEVKTYVGQIRDRVLSRWSLPYGSKDAKVELRFRVDAAGSATAIEFVGGDNALGASAIDAMRSASPFPALPDRARCLANKYITATFISDSA